MPSASSFFLTLRLFSPSQSMDVCFHYQYQKNILELWLPDKFDAPLLTKDDLWGASAHSRSALSLSLTRTRTLLPLSLILNL